MQYILVGIASAVLYALAQVETGSTEIDCANTPDAWECVADRPSDEEN